VPKTLMLTLVLLTSAVWLQAQSGPTPDKKSTLTTIQGCLRMNGGRYILTDNNGTVHDLQGDTARLSRYVGHEVEITGKPSIRTTNTSQINIASSATEQPSFTVQSGKQISATCTSAAQ